MLFFFFKQKTAYEMRISDWSSDVCSSDLFVRIGLARLRVPTAVVCAARGAAEPRSPGRAPGAGVARIALLRVVPRRDANPDNALLVAERAGVGEIGRASCKGRVG